MYRALKYKVENDKFYANVRIDESALNDLPTNTNENVFHRLKTVHME